MSTKLILKNKLNLVAALVILFSAITASTVNAKTVTVTTSTNWSNITTGSGTNGVPNATDDIIVYGGTKNQSVILTIDQNAEAKSLTLGDYNGNPSIGGLVIATGKIFNVYGNFDAIKPSNFNGQGLYNSLVLNTNSQLNVMGVLGTHLTQSGLGTLNINVALPVEFISFTATKQANTAILNFATAWEINNAGFEVERSTNGISWSKIGFVQGKGNSTEISNYSFATPLANINSAVVYYRLKQVDFNGQFEYSATRTIRLGAAAAKTTSVYPNPATSKISVSLEGIAAGEMAKVSVMDMSGTFSIRFMIRALPE